MLAQSSNSEIFHIVERMNPELLGAIAMVGTILTFVMVMLSIFVVSRTIQNIYLSRMQNQMLNELIAKGYSVEEIQQLVYNNRRSALFRFFDKRSQSYVNRALNRKTVMDRDPAPPIK